ncbi:MAG: hypothetical protein ACRDNL_23480 [Spirillospora sp.]
MSSEEATETTADAVEGAGPTTTQENWRFCNKCFGLWWNGRSTNGPPP